MPRIVEEWAINAEFQGVVLSAGYFGVMIGYLILSPFSARIGLKRMVVVCLVFMGLFNVATITATNPTMLLGFRIATGISLGGVFPPAVALTCEYFPERYRASRFRVYEREGERCPTAGCGGTIERVWQTGRSTFYCPVCQR